MAEKLELEVSVNTDGLQKGLKQAGDDIKSFNQRVKSERAIELSLNIAKLKSQLEEVRSQIKNATSKTQEFTLRANAERLQREVTQAGRELTNFVRTGNEGTSVLGKNFQSLWDVFSQTKQSLIGVGGVIGGAVATAFGFAGAESVKLASNLQQAQVAFTTMLGSEQEAQALLQELSEFAKNTPFELVGIRDSAKQLMAMGVSTENLLPTLKMLGDVSAGLSVPLDRLGLAYGQVLAKGRLQGGELKQFTEAGVPLIAELATMLGKTTGKISKMVEAGDISAVDVTKAFQKMTSEVGKFGNMMDKQAQTVAGKFSNLVDSTTQLGESVGTKFLPMLDEAVQGVNGLVADYGDSIGTILVDTISILTGIVWEFFSNINEVFASITWSTAETGEDVLSIGKIFMYVLSGFITGLQWLVFSIKTIWTFIGAFLWGIANSVEIILKGLYNGFSKLGDAIAVFMKNIGMNIAIGIQNSVAKAIEWVNKLIDLVNQVPGVKIGKLQTIKQQGFVATWSVWNPFAWQFSWLSKSFEKPFTIAMENATDDFAKMAESISNRNSEIAKIGTKVVKTAKKPWGIDLWSIPKTWWDDDPKKKKAGAKGKSAEQIAKDKLEAKKKALEQQAELEIKAVNASTITEAEKAKKILAINDKLKKDLQILDGKYIDAQVDNAKEVIKSEEEQTKARKEAKEKAYKELVWKEEQNMKDVRDLANEYQKLKEKLKEVGEDGAEDIKKISDEITDLNKKIAETKGTGVKDIGARGIEASKELKDALKGVNQSTLENAITGIDKKTLAQFGELSIGGQQFTGEELTNILGLLQEIQLVNQNTTEEQRKQATIESEKSKTQLILDEMNAKVADLELEKKNAEEKKKIREDLLKADQLAIQTKMDAIALQIYNETQLILQENEKRKVIEQQYTDFFGEQMKAREEAVKSLIATLAEAKTAISASWFSSTIAQSAGANQSTQNIVNNVTNNTDVDAESFLRKLGSLIPTK